LLFTFIFIFMSSPFCFYMNKVAAKHYEENITN
jgi:hypothetical protein